MATEFLTTWMSEALCRTTRKVSRHKGSLLVNRVGAGTESTSRLTALLRVGTYVRDGSMARCRMLLRNNRHLEESATLLFTASTCVSYCKVIVG